MSTADPTPDALLAVLRDGDRAAWTMAAASVALRADPSDDDEVVALARAVLAHLGAVAPDDPTARQGIASAATAPLLQAARFLEGGAAWTDQDDAALIAQGQASAQNASAMAGTLQSQLEGLGDLLASPGAAMLDVGVGVAGMAVGICRALPGLRIVGLDVFPRALELARDNVAEAGLEDRIELRLLDVAELDDPPTYGLVWIPAPFVPRASLDAGLARMAASLRDGGWLLLAHGRLTGDEVEVAITRLKTAAYGGTALDDVEAEALLRGIGLRDVHHIQTHPLAPAMAAGRR